MLYSCVSLRQSLNSLFQVISGIYRLDHILLKRHPKKLTLDPNKII